MDDNKPYTVKDASTLPTDTNKEYLHLELIKIDLLVRKLVQKWVTSGQNPEDKFRGLSVSGGQVQEILNLPFFCKWGTEVTLNKSEEKEYSQALGLINEQQEKLRKLASRQGFELRLEVLQSRLKLSEYEYQVFLVCMLAALDSRYEQVFGFLQDDVTRKYPSSGLILDLLTRPELSRFLALTVFSEDSRLLRFGLIRPLGERREENTLLKQTFLASPEIISWLLGNYAPAEKISSFVEFIPPQHLEKVNEGLLDQVYDPELLNREAPLLIFYGSDGLRQKMAVHHLAAQQNKALLWVDLSEGYFSEKKPEASIFELILRDVLLNDVLVGFSGWDVCLDQDGLVDQTTFEIINRFPAALVLSGSSFWRVSISDHMTKKPAIWQNFGLPSANQRVILWEKYLPEFVKNGKKDIQAIAGQFALSSRQIRNAAAAARDIAFQEGRPLEGADLFEAARLYSSHHLDNLAIKIKPRYNWQDIVLPENEITILHEIVNTVRGQTTVLEKWGLKKKLVASAGVSALFGGPPGTGKTLAAQVIAAELGMDLYKIDLSTVVSKYIGETEKNLERIFSQAKNSNAILFFDEADAIFGKRSEVKDAHDRYANIEVGYLLQRMETYDGVVILATNLRANMDDAFTRRLQFVIDFPFPDEQQRAEIWKVLFPPELPREKEINFTAFARQYKMAGGNIRNVIVQAAFLAASNGEVVTNAHLLHGVKRELQKMGRLINEKDLTLDL